MTGMAGMGKFTIRRWLGGLGVTFTLWLNLSPALYAVCDQCVVAAIADHKITMIQQFMELKIHLTEEFSELKKQLTREIKTVRQSLAQVEKDSLRVQQDIDFMLPSGGCETATAGAAVGASRDRVESYVRAFNHHRREEADATAASVAMIAQQLERYCAPEDKGRGGCTEASEQPNAPFLLETLLSGSGIGDDVDPQEINTYLPEVLSFDEQRVTDARRFIENAVDPYPLTDLPSELQGTPQGTAFWMRKKVYESKLGFARHSLNHALAMRTPSAALRGWLEDVWAESKTDEHKAALLAELPDNISYLELLKTEVDRRYASPTWYAGIASNPAAAVLREMAYMQALQLNLDFQRLRQGERLELLLARLVLDSTEQSGRDDLQAELAAAEQLVSPDSTSGDSSTSNDSNTEGKP